MPDDESPPADAAAEDAFALIGNETRAAILRALGQRPHEGVSFSELREAVDPGMDSGQFNYHLSQLTGEFVDRGEDGYTMRAEGLTLYRLIRAGSVNRRVSLEPFETGLDCYFCGTPVEGRYDEGNFELRCPGCDHVYAHTQLPPSAVETGDRGDLLERVDQYNRHDMLAYARGVCPICASALEFEFVAGDEVWTEGSGRLDVFLGCHCDHCGSSQYMSVGLAHLYHPAVVSFFHDHGVDVTTRPHWELEWAMTDEYLTVRSTDPWEVALSIPCEGETLELVVDEALSVDATRTAGSE
ncbi:helix-turn-helix transcriptional regulator [Halosimplex litoreum]|uniref:Helix-turn-helix transcriptional regulator n=1 Tax=Halosimplex litoreum TaxID=1198301 RepID=A0A7T3G045_9EURY|nr:helix-turn-helix domain-containing protein [Halosimplex litoreum]QPV63910.1 helix-turn-helix transcriptional regulator [Halosimplex litoreum]